MDIAAIDSIAGAQHGVVTSAQAIAVLGRRRKERWAAAGRLIVVQPRVWRLAGAPTTWHLELMAAQLSSDGDVSHRSSAEMWGLIRPAGFVEVAVHLRRHPRLVPPAIVHRIVDARHASTVQREGLRITDPARTLVDLGLVLPQARVRDALSTALSRRLLRLDDLRRLRNELSKSGRNGVGVIGDLLEERTAALGVEESVLEGRLIALLRRCGLPRAVLQHEVWSNGRFVARIDAAYPDAMLAIEVDGYAYHTSPEAFQQDRTRQNELVALGWMVLRFTWDDVVRRPEEVGEAIADALRRLGVDFVCA